MYAQPVNTRDRKYLNTSNKPTQAWRTQGRKPLLRGRSDRLQRSTEQNRQPAAGRHGGHSPPRSSVRGEALGTSPSPASTPEVTQRTLRALHVPAAPWPGLQPRGALRTDRELEEASCAQDPAVSLQNGMATSPRTQPHPSGSWTVGRSVRPSPPRGRERPPPPRVQSWPLGPSC